MENTLTQITNYLATQSWQIAVLAVAIAAVSLLLKNKSAHVRYLLWLIVLAKCLTPPLLTIPLAVLPQQQIPQPAAVVPAEIPPLSIEPARPVIYERPAALAPAPPVIERPSIGQRLSGFAARQWVPLTWIAGFVLFFSFTLIKAFRTNHWLRRARRPLPAGLQQSIDKLFSELGIRSAPKLWLVKDIGQPFVWGLLRGGIYLPADFAKLDSAKHRRGILGHELSHVLRFDAAVNLLQIVVQAVFWFHPFVWWANKKIRAEREKCCDEMAIARLNAEAKDYSTAIVNTLIAEHRAAKAIPSLAVAGPVKNIEDRIKTILKPNRKFYKRPSFIVVITILLVALIAVPTTLALTSRPPKKTDVEVGVNNPGIGIRKVFLPNVEKEAVALDLATGELIKISCEGEIDFQNESFVEALENLKQGDLICGEGGFICLRGARVKGIRRFFEHDFPFLWYMIPEYLPHITIVTTGQGRRYNLNVLEGSLRGYLLAYSEISSDMKASPEPFLFEQIVSRKEFKLAESANKLHELCKRMLIYANEYDEKYPENLKLLTEVGVSESEMQWLIENVVYLGDKASPMSSPRVVLAYDKSTLEHENNEGTNVLYNDCHISFEKTETLKKLGIQLNSKTDVEVEGGAIDSATEETGETSAKPAASSGGPVGLQQLIDSARPGATVTIPKGIHTEPISINKSTTLKGESPADCVFEITADEPAIFVDTKGEGRVTIEGITIKWQLATSDKNIKHPFAVAVKDSIAEFRNCAFVPLGNFKRCPTAIQAVGFSTLFIEGCRFDGFEYTVCYGEGTEGTIQDCVITASGHQGISLYEDAKVRIERNIVAGSKYHGVRSTGGTLFLKDNLIINNDNRGVYLGNKSAQGTISNNVIMGNECGISAFGQSQVNVRNNIIADSSYAGIQMAESCKLVISDNIIQDNERGLILSGEGGRNDNNVNTNTFWKNRVDAENLEKPGGSIMAEPVFADAEIGDFSLTGGKPLDEKQGLTNPQTLKALWERWHSPTTESKQVAGATQTDVEVDVQKSKASGFDELLDNPVTIDIDRSPDGDRLSIQYAIIAICESAGVPYQWEKSARLAEPQRRRYIQPVHIKDVRAKKALLDILKPNNLGYGLDDNGLYLYKSTDSDEQGKRSDVQGKPGKMAEAGNLEKVEQNPVGKWRSVDFVEKIEDFKPGVKSFSGELFLKDVEFKKGGKTSSFFTWKKGWIRHEDGRTRARYQIKRINGTTYLFLPWLSGDVTIRGQKPSYYVMEKAGEKKARNERQQITEQAAPTVLASEFVELLAKENFPAATKNFDATMKQAMPPERLADVWKGLAGQTGAFKEQIGARTEKMPGFDIVYVTCEFEKGPLDIKVVYDNKRQVSGLWFVPVPQHVLKGYQNNQTKAPSERKPTDEAVYKQLEEIFDLSKLTPEMHFSDALDVIKNSVEPPLNVFVFWNDLYDEADVDRTSPIKLDSDAKVPLKMAFNLLLDSVSGGLGDLTYTVADGLIYIGPKQSLRKKVKTSTHNISDVLGAPSTATIP